MKPSKKDLEEQIYFLESLIDSIPTPVFYKNSEGVYLGCNNAFAKFIGLKKEEIIGKSVYDIVSKELADTHTLSDQSLLGKGGHRTYESSLTPKGGSRRDVILHKARLKDRKGKVVGFVGTINDITDRKEAEEAILEYAKVLGSLNASKDKFFSIISHDMRTPFVGLLGFTRALAEVADTLSKEDIVARAKDINRAAERLFKLLQNLLDWARLQRRQMEYTPADFDLAEMVRNTLTLYSENAAQKKIRLLSALEGKTLIYADENMVFTVLRNLVSNAVKFTREEGEVKVGARPERDFIAVSVSDTGVGMPQEVVEKIFEIDSQYKTKGTANEQGTGLGLILCAELVQKNGGRCWVESEVDKGSSFYFTLRQSVLKT